MESILTLKQDKGWARFPSCPLVAALFVAGIHPFAVQAGQIDELAWMAGCWISQAADSRSEHCWMSPRGGSMLGIQRDIKQGQTRFVEFVKIDERGEQIVFSVLPIGQEPTEFQLSELEDRRAVFSNPSHDYPQRIIYLIDGDELVAQIEGVVNGKLKTSEWRWRETEQIP